MAGRVQGKVAFITGVARAQGRSHALRLAEEGADIIGVDVPDDIDNLTYPMSTQDDLNETISLVEKLDRPATGSGGAGYALAKRTIAQLVHDLSVALAPRMIRVNAVHPTNVNTMLLHNEPMYRIFRPDLAAPTAQDASLAFPAMQAMPIPFIEPQDVSQAVLFLASDESRYVTGLQLRVDAGSLPKQTPLTPGNV
jgi:NAD(P)-dependent dehydrogenase (short-subunit alcohol dehydrogenase family)